MNRPPSTRARRLVGRAPARNSSPTRWSRLALAGVMGLILSVGAAADPDPATAQSTAGFRALDAPQRLLDTRGEPTADGRDSGGGRVGAGRTYRLQVGGRVGLPESPAAMMLNVTAVQPAAAGHVTVFPCGTRRPNASNLNYAAGQTVPNAVIATPNDDGLVCLYSHAASHLIVDASGWYPSGSYRPLAGPRRLLDTRPGSDTADGRFAGGGRRSAGSVTPLAVAGRVGLGDSPAAVALNVTVAAPGGPGYVTVYPCDSDQPNASNINYQAGRSVPNLVVTRVAAGGRVCLFTSAAAHLVVDVSGSLPNSAFRALDAPQRVLDTRAGSDTADGRFSGWGQQPAGSTLQLRLAGRVGIPENASAVVLNVTAIRPEAPGHLAVHPRGSRRPTASNVNYRPGQVVANSVVARVGRAGDVCVFSHSATDIVVDVAGWLTGPPPPTTGGHCPAVAPSDANAGTALVERPGMHRVAGTDRIAVLGCNSEGGTVSADPGAVASWANDTVTPWFEAASQGAYGPVFEAHPQGVISRDTTWQCEQAATAPGMTVDPYTSVLVYDSSDYGGGHATPGSYLCGPTVGGCVYPYPLLSEPPSTTGRMISMGGGAVTNDQAAVVHEVGHTIQWPHSYTGKLPDDSPGREYDNPVDVMSGQPVEFSLETRDDFCERGSGRYVWCHPQNTLALNRYAAGWVGAKQALLHTSGRAHYRLDRPMGNGVQFVALRDPSEGRRFMTIEARPATRRDRYNDKAGVAVHLTDQVGGIEGVGVNRRQRQAVGDPNTYDHVLAPGESFRVRGVTVRNLGKAGDGYLVRVTGTYRAPANL